MIPLVIDTNILFTALYNISGLERKILNITIEKQEIQLFAPDLFWKEIRRNLQKKLDYQIEEIDILISKFDIIEVPFEKYKIKIPEAKKLISHENDVPFIAVCLLINAPIWSGNKNHLKHLLSQETVLWFNTKRLFNFLNTQGIFD